MFPDGLFIQKVEKPISLHKLFYGAKFSTSVFKDQPKNGNVHISNHDQGSHPIICRHAFMKTYQCSSLLMIYLLAFPGKAGTAVWD